MVAHLRDQGAVAHNNDSVGITDGNGIVHTTTRSLRKINYAEAEEALEYLDEDEDEDDVVNKEDNQLFKEDPNQGDAGDYDDDDGEDNIKIPLRKDRGGQGGDHDETPKRRTLRTTGRKNSDDEDESFHENESDEPSDFEVDEDEYLDDEYGESKRDENYRRRRADRKFVVPDLNSTDVDAQDEDEDIEYGSERNSRRRSRRNAAQQRRTPSISITTPPRNLRRRTRSAYIQEEAITSAEKKEALTLADEIRELQEDSPINEKRSLRERTKQVDYTIPPPLIDSNQDDMLRRGANAYGNPSPRRGRVGWNSTQNVGPNRRLFPTGGPFGGNDVTTIFGINTNFYNQDAQGNFTSLNDNNKRLIDSDSSEDEILPLGAEPKDKIPKPKKKKKPEIADLDPLCVDMNINFDDVGGLDNYIDQLKEMVALPLLYPELYQNFDITPPRGVLFHGPPGTGKTLMARALAASCSSETRKITFFMRKGADILSKWVGEAERQLRLLFEEAKKNQPSIIFFDEIDGLAPVRSSKQEQIHASIVSTMLALMDGMDNRGQVIVIGATNRPDAVDPALRRPGRFDREFYFPLPDVSARAKILQIHTKKWNPPLAEDFIQNLAVMTKGYGGADLRALCTESALISIQHKYPQIYRTNDKLQVDPSKIKVSTGDFMLALEKIIPSSARSAGSTAQPLPEFIVPLLNNQLDKIKITLDRILPKNENEFDRSKSLIQQFIDYEDYDDNEIDDTNISGFAKHSLLNRITNSRICKPRLLICGPFGNGQQYIGPAILNFLEHYNVQKLDLASLVSDSTRTLESTIVQSFVEARKRQPSVIYIPNIDIWSKAVPENVILTLATLLRSLQNSERVLLLGIAESLEPSDLENGPLAILGFSRDVCELEKPSSEQRTEYFSSLKMLLGTSPDEFSVRRKRTKPLPVLPLAKPEASASNFDDKGNLLSPTEILRNNLKELQHQDMKLKNVLKIKLSGFMDLFKNRYKRFRKPPIDDAYLVHLFEPIATTDPTWQPAYTKDGDMILEVATGRRFNNMDLDIVEERLWNGYYSEPKQFLKDIELIYNDANIMGDRERIIKASEMFANAQMGIEDISTKEFIEECKATRKRDLKRQELCLMDEQARLSVVQQNENAEESKQVISENGPEGAGLFEVGTGSGHQLQAQLQNLPNNRSPIQRVSFESKEVIMSEEDVQSNNSNKENDRILEQKFSGAPTLKTVEESNTNLLSVIEPIISMEDISPSENQILSVQNIIPEEEDMTEKEVTVETPKILRKIIVDDANVSQIIEDLKLKTSGFTISQLEEIYSSVVSIIWEDRLLWDKSGTSEKIKDFISL